MIVCNKCASVIPEPPEEEPKEKDKKDKLQVPSRRPSLVLIPYKRSPNGFQVQWIDMCDACRADLTKRINKLKFEFMTEG